MLCSTFICSCKLVNPDLTHKTGTHLGRFTKLGLAQTGL